MTSLVQFRMESEDKEVLEALLKDMGLDLGTAFRIFAQKVLKTGKIPFEINSNMDFVPYRQKKMKKPTKKP